MFLKSKTIFFASELKIRVATLIKSNPVFSLSTENTLALGAGFASVGVQAEVAGTTIITFSKKIDDALNKGGEALNTLTVITGMTADEIKKNLIESPEKIFIAFSKGLKEVGQDAGKVLASLGLNNVRTAKSFFSAAKNVGIFTDALEASNEASEKNTKLQQETDLVLKTTAKEFDGLWASVKRLGASIGALLAWPVNKLFGGLSRELNEIAEFFELAASAGKKFFGLFTSDEDSTEESASSKIGTENKKARINARKVAVESGAITQEEADEQTSNDKLQEELDEKNRILKEDAIIEAEIEADKNETKDDVSKTRKETLAELVAGLKNEKLEKESEDFDKELETLEKRLGIFDNLKKFYVNQEIIRDLELLKKKAKNAKDIARIDALILKTKKESNKSLIEEEIGALKTLFDEKTAIGKAAIIAEKAFAISQIIMFTAEGVSKALSKHDYFTAAVVATKGAAEVATVSGISAQEGGIVPGGFGGGDRVPALLEAGEIVVPSSLNPLNPNFDDTFGSGGGEQQVNVTIGLEEDASRVLTVKQREDSKLGLQE